MSYIIPLGSCDIKFENSQLLCLWIMAIYHDVRELMQEDNRPTFVGVVRFKMEINVTREWYKLGNAMPSRV
jgi:hypothetical protein